MNNTLKEMKSEIASLGNRVDQIKERISDIKDRNLEKKIRRKKRETKELKIVKEKYKNYLTHQERHHKNNEYSKRRRKGEVIREYIQTNS